jgi:hypothetical protein
MKIIRAVTVKIIKEPKDIFTKNNTMIGNSFVINKKKYPYLIKYGYIKIKLQNGINIILYRDEIDIEVEIKKNKV